VNAERNEKGSLEREMDGIEAKGEKQRAEVSAIRERKERDSVERDGNESERKVKRGKGREFDATCV
jgi:hypothetical protein